MEKLKRGSAIDRIINDNQGIARDGMETAIQYIRRDIAEINQKLDDKYVTKDEFDPVKKLVYGMVAIILVAVIGALLTLVLRK